MFPELHDVGKRTEQAVPSTLRTSRQRYTKKVNEADLEEEQEDESEDDDPAELEKLPEEDDVILEESCPEEGDADAEAHMTEATVGRWRAKRKTAGMRNGRGFHPGWQPSVAEG